MGPAVSRGRDRRRNICCPEPGRTNSAERSGSDRPLLERGGRQRPGRGGVVRSAFHPRRRGGRGTCPLRRSHPPTSELVRPKIVEPKTRGTPTAEVAKTFGVGLSTVKRYAAAAREGRSLAPKKRPGSKPKLNEAARKLLEADLEERPAATLPERRKFLRRAGGAGGSGAPGFREVQ